MYTAQTTNALTKQDASQRTTTKFAKTFDTKLRGLYRQAACRSVK